ncbi:hypothetical protein D3C76_676010 [compost metagenome]
MLGLSQEPAGIFEGFPGFEAQGLVLEMDVEVFQGPQAVALHALEPLHGGQVRFEPQGFHQGFARQIKQAVQALGGDPQHALAVFGSAPGLFRRDRQRLRLFHHRCGRFELQLCHQRRGGYQVRYLGSHRIEQTPHQRDIGVDFRRPRHTVRRRDAHQQIGALQQRVDVLRAQVQAPFLGTDQAIFHDMRDADAGIDADDSRRAFERMRRTHARFEMIGLGRITLQRQQTCAEHLGLGLGFQTEQLQQRGVAHLLGGHVRLRVTADNNCSSSSQRRLRPLNCSTPRVYLALACAPERDAASRMRSSMA